MQHSAYSGAVGLVLVLAGLTPTQAASPGSFQPVSGMKVGRNLPAIALLPNGTALVSGGETGDLGSGFNETATTEIFDPKTSTFTPSGRMNQARI